MPVSTATLLRRFERAKDVFGPRARDKKIDLLRDLNRRTLNRASQVLRLHEALSFLRAYPDDREVLDRVEAMRSRKTMPSRWSCSC